MKRRRYYPPHKPNYSVLFTEEDKINLLYKTDLAFRMFVIEWNADDPNLLGWTLADFYKAYKQDGIYELYLQESPLL